MGPSLEPAPFNNSKRGYLDRTKPEIAVLGGEEQPCQVGGGDCDKDSQCSPGLMCGTNNCLLFDKLSESDADCCMNPCGKGFELIPGDSHEVPLFQSKVGDTDRCAELCLSTNLCKSYEYSVTEKRCHLQSELKPNFPVWKDYVFCSLKGTL